MNPIASGWRPILAPHMVFAVPNHACTKADGAEKEEKEVGRFATASAAGVQEGREVAGRATTSALSWALDDEDSLVPRKTRDVLAAMSFASKELHAACSSKSLVGRYSIALIDADALRRAPTSVTEHRVDPTEKVMFEPAYEGECEGVFRGQRRFEVVKHALRHDIQCEPLMCGIFMRIDAGIQAVQLVSHASLAATECSSRTLQARLQCADGVGSCQP